MTKGYSNRTVFRQPIETVGELMECLSQLRLDDADKIKFECTVFGKLRAITTINEDGIDPTVPHSFWVRTQKGITLLINADTPCSRCGRPKKEHDA